MNYIIKLYVKDIKEIYRKITFNSNMSLDLFIRCLILSLNGKTDELYLLAKKERIIEFDEEDIVSSLRLKIGDKYQILYCYNDDEWDLEFEILDESKELNPKDIKILDGAGSGICQSEAMDYIKSLMYYKPKDYKEDLINTSKTLKNYFELIFLIDDSNKLLEDYIIFYKEIHQPKSIMMDISLNGFDKVIKRRIIVNNNILIDKFCRCIIRAMNGEMDHLYAIKINKQCYDDNILYEKLKYLDLSVGKKFEVIYDFGDNWQFNIKVKKFINSYHNKEFEILKGEGYGIVEDCGGIWGLDRVFKGESDYFDQEDINNFNLEELQKNIEEELKIENLHQIREEYY